jgi:hypothetical protein
LKNSKLLGPKIILRVVLILKILEPAADTKKGRLLSNGPYSLGLENPTAILLTNVDESPN